LLDTAISGVDEQDIALVVGDRQSRSVWAQRYAGWMGEPSFLVRAAELCVVNDRTIGGIQRQQAGDAIGNKEARAVR